MTYKEAVNHLLNGAILRRNCWPLDWSLKYNYGRLVFYSRGAIMNGEFSDADKRAIDWEIIRNDFPHNFE